MDHETQHIVEDIWKQYDEDQSGTLNVDDTLPFFKIFIANRPDLGLTEENYQTWFDAIDGDHDGTITKEEMGTYLASVQYKHHHH